MRLSLTIAGRPVVGRDLGDGTPVSISGQRRANGA